MTVLDLWEVPPTRPGLPRRSPDPSRISPMFPRPIPNLPVGAKTCTEPTGISTDPSWTSQWVCRPVQDIPECLPTRPGPP